MPKPSLSTFTHLCRVGKACSLSLKTRFLILFMLVCHNIQLNIHVSPTVILRASSDFFRWTFRKKFLVNNLVITQKLLWVIFLMVFGIDSIIFLISNQIPTTIFIQTIFITVESSPISMTFVMGLITWRLEGFEDRSSGRACLTRSSVASEKALDQLSLGRSIEQNGSEQNRSFLFYVQDFVGF